MTKIVYNTCYGGFGLSNAAVELYARKTGLNIVKDQSVYIGKGWTSWLHNGEYWSDRSISRTDKHLVATVEELGDAASGHHASLKIADLPPGTKYRIDEYDGLESVMTIDDYDWKTA